jgi:Lrp/AsnC family transcriptional regulator, leucine-responsive regulatory protein
MVMNDDRIIDEIDTQILTLVQQNARITNADIARQVEMAPSAILERIRKLEMSGLILGYEARLNAAQIGLGLLAFIFVNTDERAGAPETSRMLSEIPAVQELHHVAGEDCFLVKVRAANTDALAELLRNEFGAIPWIRSTRTTIVLTTVKETAQLPIPEVEITHAR